MGKKKNTPMSVLFLDYPKRLMYLTQLTAVCKGDNQKASSVLH